MATRKSNNKKQGRGGKMRLRGDRQLIPHPPQIGSYGITHATRLRFVTNTAVNQALITFSNLLDALNIATGAAASFQLFRQVKVRRVQVWATPVIGNATTVQVEFPAANTGFAGDAAIHTDTSMSIEPAYVSAVPSRMSGASLFQFSSAITAMAITCPSGTVVDVELTYRGLPGTATATSSAPVAATVGAWYYRGLDGLALAATVFTPVINGSGAN
jgi:hypothetical protein